MSAEVPGGGRLSAPYLCNYCGIATIDFRVATGQPQAWRCCTMHARMEQDAGRPTHWPVVTAVPDSDDTGTP